MIRDDFKRAAVNIVSELFRAPDNRQTFQFICAIFQFGGIEESGAKCDGFPPVPVSLFEACSESRMAAVAFDSAVLVYVKVCDTMEVSDRLFDLGECVGVFQRPHEFVLLFEEVAQNVTVLGKFGNEA